MSLRSKLEGIRQIWQFDNRYELLLARTLFPGRNPTIYKYKGLEFITDHLAGDVHGARELLTTDMYRPFLSKIDLPKVLNVLDLGANNGGFPLLLLSEGFQLKTLACVEVNPKTFSRMRYNIENNTTCEFHLINAAVCGENKTLDLVLGDGDPGDNIYAKGNRNGLATQVQGKTFDAIYEDTFGDEQVDLCKIDIEGAEFEMFRSGTFQKLKNCRNILVEIHHEKEQDRDRLEIIGGLADAGFREINGEEKTDAFHHVHLFLNTNLTKGQSP